MTTTSLSSKTFNIVDLFVAILKNENGKVAEILSYDPALTEQKMTSKDELREFYKRDCENHAGLNPLYLEETPLLFAARHGRTVICIDLIFKFGANVNAINIYGQNALMNALSYGNGESENLATGLAILNSHKVDLTTKTYGKYDVFRDMIRNLHHNQGDLKLIANIVDLFIDTEGFDINELQGKDSNQKSAFIIACENQNWWLAIYLIEKGADYSFNSNSVFECNMYSLLCANEYLPPNAKNRILDLFEMAIKKTGNKFGEFKRPEHLYKCMMTGEVKEFKEV